MEVNKGRGESGNRVALANAPFMETLSQGNGDFLSQKNVSSFVIPYFFMLLLFIYLFNLVLLTRGQASKGQDKHIFFSSLYPQNLVHFLALRGCSINLSYTLELLWKSFPWINCERN